MPVLDPAVWAATTTRYLDAFQRLTGLTFVPGDYPVDERIAARLDEITEEWS